MISRTILNSICIFYITASHILAHDPRNLSQQPQTPSSSKKLENRNRTHRQPSPLLLRRNSQPSMRTTNTYTAQRTKEPPIPLHEQYTRVKQMIYEHKNTQLLYKYSHMMRNATSYATTHGIPTPLDHINMSHNTQLLRDCLQIYEQPNTRIPQIVRYGGIVTAIQNNQKHVELLIPYCRDAINIALCYQQLTPIHHAVAARNIYALDQLLQYAYNRRKALQTKQKLPGYDTPVTPREIAERTCPECIDIIDRFIEGNSGTESTGAE